MDLSGVDCSEVDRSEVVEKKKEFEGRKKEKRRYLSGSFL